jgi:signal transduction histidine kinase
VILIAAITLLAGWTVGYFAYRSSREKKYQAFSENVLSMARIIATAAKETSVSESEFVAKTCRLWSEVKAFPSRSYLSVVGLGGKLLADTGNPGRIGTTVEYTPIHALTPDGPRNLGELIAAKRDYVGRYVSSQGQMEIASFVYVKSLDLAIGIHVPREAVEATVRASTLTWAAGIGLITIILMFLGFSLFYWTCLVSQRSLQNKISELSEGLAQANNVKAEFLGLMSHELKTPLNVIMGYTYLLLDGYLGDLNGEQSRSLQMIATQSKILLGLVDSIMEATKAAARAYILQRSRINIAEFLAEIQQFYPASASSNIKLSWDFSSDVPAIETDPDKLRQILRNLINNAIKFTARGQITVSARVFKNEPEAQARGEQKLAAIPAGPVTASDFLEFRVMDTGIGIQKKDLPFIFEMFRQVDSSSTREYDGLGMGLYIARSLTELLGGTIEVESEINKGSTFIVTIPVQAAADSDQSDNSSGTVQRSPPKSPEPNRQVDSAPPLSNRSKYVLVSRGCVTRWRIRDCAVPGSCPRCTTLRPNANLFRQTLP